MGTGVFQLGRWGFSAALFASWLTTDGAPRLPVAVEKAVMAAYPAAQIREVERERQKGVVTYEVELLVEGKEIEVKVDAAGVIGSVEQDLPAKDAPEAVARACSKEYPEAKIQEVERREIRAVLLFGGFAPLRDPVVVYEVELKLAGGGEAEIVLDSTGKVLRGKADDGDDDDDDDDD